MKTIYKSICNIVDVYNIFINRQISEWKNLIQNEPRNYYFTIFTIYAFLSILLTYPMVIYLSRHMVDAGSGYDALIFTWNNYTLQNNILSFSNPYFTNNIYYPDGTNFAYSTINGVYALLSFPFRLFGWEGLIIGYNFTIILSFTLSGFIMFLFADYIIKNKAYAFVAGIIFAYCNFKYANTVRAHVFATEFVVLYVFTFIRFLNDVNYRNAIWVGISASLQLYACLELFGYIIVFSVLYFFIWYLRNLRYVSKKEAILRTSILIVSIILFWFILKVNSYIFIFIMVSEIFILGLIKTSTFQLFNFAFLKKIIVVLLLFIIISSPLLYNLYIESYKMSSHIGDFNWNNFWVADLADYLLLNQRHMLWKKDMMSATGLYHGGNGRDQLGDAFFGLAIGISVIVLMLIGFVRSYMEKKHRILSLFALLFISFSLGPILHLGGYICKDIFTPYYWLGLKIFPYLWSSRVPLRFVILFFTFGSIIAAFGMQYVVNRFKTINKKGLVYFLISAVIVFEYLPYPIPMTKMNIPKMLWEVRNETSGTILPFPINYDNRDSVLFQTVHEKPVIGNFNWAILSPSKNAMSTINEAGFVKMYDALTKPQTFNSLDKEAKVELLQHCWNKLTSLKVKWFILEPGAIKEYLSHLKYILENYFGCKYMGPDFKIEMYKMPDDLTMPDFASKL